MHSKCRYYLNSVCLCIEVGTYLTDLIVVLREEQHCPLAATFPQLLRSEPERPPRFAAAFLPSQIPS